jgi:hypothetical protein
LIACAFPCLAAVRPVTVAQLHETLAAQQAENKSDRDRAQQLRSLILKEQLTDLTRAKMTAEFKPGPQTALVLDLMADFSAFLEPPASEWLDRAQPTAAEQQTMLNAAVNFVAVTLRHLPNFLATRLTDSYDDSPVAITHSGWSPPSDLHLVGTFSQEITYRDGREVADHLPTASSGSRSKHTPSPSGLTSTGEFGGVLGTILKDTSKGTIKWSHWEQTATGQVGVFHYEVPQAVSHYSVNFCCVKGSEDAMNYGGGIAGGKGSSPVDEASANSYHGTPSYHGNLYLDPVTGSILRITIETELKASDPIERAEILVQYGSMEIGGQVYICPVQSFAISKVQSHSGGDMSDRTILRINEVKFTDYHRFGSTVRLLPDTSSQ